MNEYRAYWNRRQVNDKRLYRGALSAIGQVMSQTANSLSVPREAAVLDAFRYNLAIRMVQTFKDGVVAALDNAAQRWGGTLPPFKKRGIVAVQKDVSAQDLLVLGIPSDKKIIETQCMGKIKTMAASLHGSLKDQFAASVEAGESQAKLVERIRGLQDQAPWKARRIAQTESTRLYNGGSMLGYEKATIVSGRRWIINTFGNVRPWHQEMANEEAKMGEPFIVMDEELMYPGDDSMGVSAANLINCACGLRPVIGKPKPGVAAPKPAMVMPEIKPERMRGHIEGKLTLDEERAIIANDAKEAGLSITKEEVQSIRESFIAYNMGGIGPPGYVDIRNFQTGILNIESLEARGIKHELAVNKIRRIERQANDIEKYINFAPKYEGTIYRGISIEDANVFLNNINIGDIIDMKGISSWSSSSNIPKKFGNITLKINNSKRGVSIKFLSDQKTENEVIFSSKNKFKIIETKIKNGRPIITVEEI